MDTFLPGQVAELLVGLKETWIGGSDQAQEGNFTWTDGRPWDYANWLTKPNGGIAENCVFFNKATSLFNQYADRTWEDLKCYHNRPFICAVETAEVQGKANISLVLSREKITSRMFHVWWTYQQSGIEAVRNVAKNRAVTTGLSISWKLVDEEERQKKVSSPPLFLKSNRILIRMINFVTLAKKTQTVADMLAAVTVFKLDLLARDKFAPGTCSGDQLALSSLHIFLPIFSDLDIDDTPSSEASNEDIIIGSELFSFLMHCPQYLFFDDKRSAQLDSMKLYVNLIDLLDTQSPRTMIQAVINILKSEPNEVLYNLTSKVFGKLDEIFQFELGSIAVALSSKSVSFGDVPFLSNSVRAVKECNKKEDCDIVTRLRSSGMYNSTSITLKY